MRLPAVKCLRVLSFRVEGLRALPVSAPGSWKTSGAGGWLLEPQKKHISKI